MLTTAHYKWLLEQVPDVDRVIDHPEGTKAQQGNPGNHYQERNFFVYTTRYPDRPMEFELTRHTHMKQQPGRPFTLTAMFRDVGADHEDLYVEGWRILATVCEGKELFPAWVADQYKRAMGGLVGALDSVSVPSPAQPLTGAVPASPPPAPVVAEGLPIDWIRAVVPFHPMPLPNDDASL